MSKSLESNDIDEHVRSKVYTQDYSPKPIIHRVKIVGLKNYVGEEGDFSEILRIDEKGELEQVSGFKLAQLNRTRLLSGSVKAWHLHFEQDEIWYAIPSCHLLVGLWDVRKDSPTKNETMRLVLGGGNSQLLFIPKGVAHGSFNVSQEAVELFYFVNQKFDIKNPDEKRISWDALGSDFWTPKRD